MTKKITFPEGFVWGASTSSYQIEGACAEDGKGPSIWDTFTHKSGTIALNQNGDLADDHYHRMRDDVALMAKLGLKAYRFSFSWPRIMPEGLGRVNHPGVDFYDRLLDALLENKIVPYPTMYHWDLPQTLQDKGGWVKRESADWFLEYASLLIKNFGDRVHTWTTFNEPWVTAYLGYYTGRHAPGITDLSSALAANHHLLLAHGRALREIRSSAGKAFELGIVLNLSPVDALSDHEEDKQAARIYDGYLNRMFLDPLLKGRYPTDMLSLYAGRMPEIKPGDMELIAQPLDFLGINYYMRNIIRHEPKSEPLEFEMVWPLGKPYSEMWEIYAPGLRDILVRVWKDYRPAKLFISENGTSVPDGVDYDQRVRDVRRIQYLQDHLEQVTKAIRVGVPLAGYFVWSLLDNFEWTEGYTRRFGIVHVDYATQARTIKDSGHWYSRVIQENGFDAEEWYKELMI